MTRITSILTGLLFLFLLSTAAAQRAALVYDLPADQVKQRYGRDPMSMLTSEQLAKINAYRFQGDTVKLLVILVEWDDRNATYSAQTLDSQLFTRNVWPGGSVADYFHEVSYGQLTMLGNAYGWYSDGLYNHFHWWDFEQIIADLDPVIDYSQYDGNGDGYVDAILFIHSGNGQEDSHNLNDIWSFALTYGDPGLPTNDGVWINRWSTTPETWPLRNPLNPKQFLGINTLNRIRVECHELSHNLGLPDLYDYDAKLDTTTYFTPADSNDHPLVDWCVMGYGGYGILSIGSMVPSHHCGWSKKRMGWIVPDTLSGEIENLVIYDIETHKDSSLYLLPVDLSQGEYFLLEYRNHNHSGMFDKFDSDFSCYFWPDLTYGGDPLDRGLLITHVHDSLTTDPYRMNDGWPTYPHYAVQVMDAGYNPAMNLTHNPEGRLTDSAQWWCPYETRRAAVWSNDVAGQSEFSPTSVPNSDGYNGPSGIVVRVDSIVGDKLYAFVHVSGESPCCAIRGDANHDGSGPDISDLLYIVEYMFSSGPAAPCPEEVDINGSGFGPDISDLVYLVSYMFSAGPPPVSCP